MLTSGSFNVGYRFGKLVKPIFIGLHESLSSSTATDSLHSDEFAELCNTPAMVRRGVDLSIWQQRNLVPLPEVIPADWNRNPCVATDSSFIKRSSLDALI